ncbi:response regulator transcription factor (plasmid) [Deinococcus sp. KNUC1210]|uniref:response regulator transcription factor n=1 Tax=Deinococcus sp. KNUC1210 TaxID=2917691 RepID=UPI001EF07ECA|nr:response regulator transcription factor [Deinococcus sp. KNUC1210]ULH17580.1 response regulator transcription factor [Deinococcus sp. KNUC1210]
MTPPDLLIIEDDADLAALLRGDLEAAGYRVRIASSVVAGLTMARAAFPNLVLLDLGLPDGTGREVLVRLRRSSLTVPILVLTGRDSVEQKVDLLTLGADDYLVKPVQPPELLARIAGHLRHRAAAEVRDEVLAYRGLVVRPARHQASYQGQPVLLSPTELRMLAVLLRQPGRVFSRDEVARELWPEGGSALRSNAVDVHMANLRKKLRAVQLHGLIRTVRQVGYGIRKVQSERQE